MGATNLFLQICEPALHKLRKVEIWSRVGRQSVTGHYGEQNLKWNCSVFLFIPFFPYRLLSVPIPGFNSCRTRTSTTRLLGCIGPFAMRWPRRVVILAWGAKKSKFQRNKTVSWIHPTSCVFVYDFGFHISTWFCVELSWGNYHKSNIVKLLVDAELWFIWFIHVPLNMWGKVPTSKRRRTSWNWFAPRDHFSPATCSHHSESQSAVDAWVSRLWSLNLLIYVWLLGPFVFLVILFTSLFPAASTGINTGKLEKRGNLDCIPVSEMEWLVYDVFLFSAALKRCKFFKCTFAAFLKSDQVFGHWAFERTMRFILGRPAMLVLINCSAGYHRASGAGSLLHGVLQVACSGNAFFFGGDGLDWMCLLQNDHSAEASGCEVVTMIPSLSLCWENDIMTAYNFLTTDLDVHLVLLKWNLHCFF